MNKVDSGIVADEDAAEARATLEILHALELEPAASQRSLSTSVGIALGLTNAYIRRAIGKGLIKVRQVPTRRYAYYLTPKGFSEKSRLTRQYLTDSFHFFRRARTECSDLYALCRQRGWRRIALAGAGELAEIATLAARDHEIELVAVIEPGRNERLFAGVPVCAELAPASVDAVLLTDLRDPQASLDALVGRFTPERVLVPKLLRVSPRPRLLEEA